MKVQTSIHPSSVVEEGAQLGEGVRIGRMYLMRAKRPQDSRGEWDLLEVAQTIPGERAFRPASESECPALRR